MPAEYKERREEYVRLVCEEMLPLVREQGIAKFCDVFCEADTFTVGVKRYFRHPRLMTSWIFRHGQEPGLKSVSASPISA